MTPAARVTAAIDLLDAWLAGAPAEQLLTTWARGHRFAGSKDRAAIRDHVFEAIRCRRSFAALGGAEPGAETGRTLMLGALVAAGRDPGEIFTGEGHAPAPLGPGEGAGPDLAELTDEVRLDCPDWLAADLRASLGPDFAEVMAMLRHRAPVFLRVNLARGTVAEAQAALAVEGIATRPHGLAATALEVTEGARRIQGSAAYRDGLVELQDVASQAVVAALGVAPADTGQATRPITNAATARRTGVGSGARSRGRARRCAFGMACMVGEKGRRLGRAPPHGETLRRRPPSPRFAAAYGTRRGWRIRYSVSTGRSSGGVSDGISPYSRYSASSSPAMNAKILQRSWCWRRYVTSKSISIGSPSAGRMYDAR